MLVVSEVFEQDTRHDTPSRYIGKERNEESSVCDSRSLASMEFTPSSWLLPKAFPFQFDRITHRRSRRWVSTWQAPVSCQRNRKTVSWSSFLIALYATNLDLDPIVPLKIWHFFLFETEYQREKIYSVLRRSSEILEIDLLRLIRENSIVVFSIKHPL